MSGTIDSFTPARAARVSGTFDSPFGQRPAVFGVLRLRERRPVTKSAAQPAAQPAEVATSPAGGATTRTGWSQARKVAVSTLV